MQWNKVGKKKHKKLFSVHWKTWKAFSINNIIFPATSSYQNKHSALFIIISWSCFKAVAVIGRRSSKIVVLQCNFCALVKALRNTCGYFILLVYFKAVGTGGARGALAPANIFQQSESALFQQSCKHFLFNLAQS